MKKVLVLTHKPFNAPIGGGPTRVYNLVKALSQHLNVSTISPYNTVKEDWYKEEFSISNSKVFQMFNFLEVIKCLRVIRKGKYDFIQFEFPWLFYYSFLTRVFTNSRIIYDSHNLEVERVYGEKKISIFWFTRWLYTWVSERITVLFSHDVIVVSDSDREGFLNYYSLHESKISILPNGIDLNKFKINRNAREQIVKEQKLDPDIQILLFVGSLNYLPNIEAVDIIFKDLSKGISSAGHLLIVGGGDSQALSEKYSHDSITFTGFVDDIAIYNQGADLLISPLISGGGTRLKILEALSSGTRVLSTSKGAEGINWDLTGDSLIIEDDWKLFSDKMKTAPTRRKVELGKFKEYYSWNNAVERCEIYNS